MSLSYVLHFLNVMLSGIMLSVAFSHCYTEYIQNIQNIIMQIVVRLSVVELHVVTPLLARLKNRAKHLRFCYSNNILHFSKLNCCSIAIA